MFLVWYDKNKFTSVIGPLVFGSYVICGVFILANADDVLLVHVVSNTGSIFYGFYIFTLTDRFIVHFTFRIASGILFYTLVLRTRFKLDATNLTTSIFIALLGVIVVESLGYLNMRT